MLSAISHPRRRQAFPGFTTCGGWLCLLLGLGTLAGCSIFSQPVLSGGSPSLQWLSSLSTTTLEAPPPVDLQLIQPVSSTGVVPGEVFEITVWDLIEPGRPTSFPVRVDDNGEIDLPHVGRIPVNGLTLASIETKVADSFKAGEWLQNPRVLVREMVSPKLRIYVTGAVGRPGVVELTPRESSVFAALVAAGGLTKQAGTHLFVSDPAPGEAAGAAEAKPNTDLSAHLAPGTRAAAIRAQGPDGQGEPEITFHSEINPPPRLSANSGQPIEVAVPPSDRGASSQTPPPAANQPAMIPTQSRADSQQIVPAAAVQEVVPAQAPQQAPPPAAPEQKTVVTEPAHAAPPEAAEPSHIEVGIATRPDQAAREAQATPTGGRWYDLSRDQDRQSLISLRLTNGTLIIVKQTASPIRVSGSVLQPGQYPLPAGQALSIIEALQMAGGLSQPRLPVAITLTRPATHDRALRRWTIRWSPGEQLPQHLPYVQPGDQLHVQATAKGRVQSVVEGLLPDR